MKKLFFTAIVLIAFNGASMVHSTVAVANDCGDWASAQASQYEEEYGCLSSADYSDLYYDYYNYCTNH